MDERAGFENQYARNGIGGSNPPASAIFENVPLWDVFENFGREIRTKEGVGENYSSPRWGDLSANFSQARTRRRRARHLANAEGVFWQAGKPYGEERSDDVRILPPPHQFRPNF